jgi:hypothetical protein
MKALRVKAHAMPVPTPTLSVRAASQVRLRHRAAEELGCPDAVDAGGFGGARLLGEIDGRVTDRCD